MRNVVIARHYTTLVGTQMLTHTHTHPDRVRSLAPLAQTGVTQRPRMKIRLDVCTTETMRTHTTTHIDVAYESPFAEARANPADANSFLE